MTHTINCDQCGHEMDIKQSLFKKISKEVNSDLESQQRAFEEEKNAFKQHTKLEAEKNNADMLRRESELLSEWKETQIEKDRANKASYDKEYEVRLKAELTDANAKIIQNNELKTANLKLTAQIDAIDANHKSQLDMKEAEGRAQERKIANDELEMINKTHYVKMDQMKSQITSLKQKAEQGSMQVQGEAQELIIEEYLNINFPNDYIEPVKPGALGADCIQHVRNNHNVDCGSILYESKNTKDFNPAWIQKLKSDMRSKEISVAVLATKVMPKDMERAGFINDIYVCPLDDFKSISIVLRRQLLEINRIRSIGEDHHDIATLLMKYLSSSSFTMDMEAIIEGFKDLKLDLDAEKRAHLRMWKREEKHLDKIWISAVNMEGSLRGIGGDSIGEIKGLEFPGEFDQID
jgi:hypothetical protein